MAGIWSFRLNFVNNLCLNYYSRNLVLCNFRGDKARVFQRVTMKPWRLVKPHANYCVDILKARCLRPAFAESYRLLRVALSKELVAVHVWDASDQWHNWRVAGMWTSLSYEARCKYRAPSLYFGIYYFFGFSILIFAFFGVFSGDFGFLYSRSIPYLLLFLNYFLSVSQWALFSYVSPWFKPLVTSLRLIKARMYCR